MTKTDAKYLQSARVCAACDEMGMVVVDGKAAACACVAARRLEYAIRAAHIPTRYQGATFASFATKGRDKSVQTAAMVSRRYVDEYMPGGNNKGLVLVGSVGTGKTHLAVAILRDLIETKGARGLFVDFRELLKLVQSTFGGGSNLSEAQVLAPVLHSDIVVLDELGAMRSTEWVADAIEHVLNTRYNESRATIVTTNYPMRGPGLREVGMDGSGYERRPAVREETLGDRVGARMYSRLSEMCYTLSLAGEDYRQSQAHG